MDTPGRFKNWVRKLSVFKEFTTSLWAYKEEQIGMGQVLEKDIEE